MITRRANFTEAEESCVACRAVVEAGLSDRAVPLARMGDNPSGVSVMAKVMVVDDSLRRVSERYSKERTQRGR